MITKYKDFIIENNDFISKYSNHIPFYEMNLKKYKIENYSIDDQSLQDSDDFSSKPSVNISSISEDENILNFIQAVKDDNVVYVQDFCAANDDNKNLINKRCFDSFYPLQYAVLFGNINMIDTLINLGSILECNIEGVPILHLSLSFASNLIY